MTVSEARNGKNANSTGQNGQEKQVINNSKCKLHLFVTFFRKNAKSINTKAEEPTRASNGQLEMQGSSNPDHDTGQFDSTGVTSRCSLNNEQQAIIGDFKAILTNIGGISLSDASSRGESENSIHPIPSFHALAYNPDIFQCYYECHLPSESLLSNPQEYNLKAFRNLPSMTTFENKRSLEVILDLFIPSPSPSPELSLSTSLPSRPIKLALFDMDSTLILEEVIDELARSIGAYEAVSAITARAMADPTFDFAASLRARVALLKGVPADVWSSLQQKVHIANGARDLIKSLKARGCTTGVISGGFTPMAEWLKGELGLDLAFANHLAVSPPTTEFSYEHLTGELDLSEGKVIVTPEFKRDTLIAEARKRDIPMQLTLAAGDGSNDLKMLGVAGLGVAWNAKPKTQEQAPMRLNGESLSELLYLLGPDGL